MTLRISPDHDRFRRIVRGKVRENLKRYVSSGELTGQKGGQIVKVPISRIDTPRFTFNDQQAGGSGQGEGDVGDPIDGSNKGKRGNKAGDTPGEHELEVEMGVDELVSILAEELELPRIENKGRKTIQSDSHKYKEIRKIGPEGLRHFKRTYKEALKREISSGTYVPGNTVVPRREDKRYRASEVTEDKVANAVIIYMMDVSGSMGDDQKHIVRSMAYWINMWIKHHYKGLESRYIIHDVSAREVTEDEFFKTREAGGTMISSAYVKLVELMEQEYPPSEWNIYAFHFSDGDNYSSGDNQKCLELVKECILPNVNLFAYGQVHSPYGSGQFIGDIEPAFKNEVNFASTTVPDKESTLKGIKDLLGKGV